MPANAAHSRVARQWPAPQPVEVRFEVISEIGAVETIARGIGVRQRRRLVKHYGRGRWRKRKGVAEVRLETGEVALAEIHWFEAHGIGKREMKLKRILESPLYG